MNKIIIRVYIYSSYSKRSLHCHGNKIIADLGGYKYRVCWGMQPARQVCAASCSTSTITSQSDLISLKMQQIHKLKAESMSIFAMRQFVIKN